MDERILIVNERFNIKKIFIVFLVIGLVASLGFSLYFISERCEDYDTFVNGHHHNRLCYAERYRNSYDYDFRKNNVQESKMDCVEVLYDSGFEYAVSHYFEHYIGDAIIYLVLPVTLGALICLWLCSYKLIVTDKRIFGKVFLGKSIDLPLDFVTANATTQILRSISVSTPSGRICFLFVKNAKEINSTIRDLLIQRQNRSSI